MLEEQNNIQLYRTRKMFFLIELFIKYFFLSVYSLPYVVLRYNDITQGLISCILGKYNTPGKYLQPSF